VLNLRAAAICVETQSRTLWQSVAGRGLQPRPKRLKDDDMAVVIENGRDGGATPVQLGAFGNLCIPGYP